MKIKSSIYYNSKDNSVMAFEADYNGKFKIDSEMKYNK